MNVNFDKHNERFALIHIIEVYRFEKKQLLYNFDSSLIYLNTWTENKKMWYERQCKNCQHYFIFITHLACQYCPKQVLITVCCKQLLAAFLIILYSVGFCCHWWSVTRSIIGWHILCKKQLYLSQYIICLKVQTAYKWKIENRSSVQLK